MYPKSVIDNQIKASIEKQSIVDSGKDFQKRKHYIIAYHILDVFPM